MSITGRGVLFAAETMATRFEFVIQSAGEEERVVAAGEEALAFIHECDSRWSRFRSDSYLHFLEREAPRRPIALEGDDWELFSTALQVWRDSHGAFDIAARSPHANSSAIELNERARTVRFHAPLTLDLGAIAKGHALDLARDHLVSRGITRALLHGGTSSVCAIGARPFAVALAGTRKVLDLCDGSLSVSAQRNRAHILDPRTREPIERESLVWIRARTGRLAEAWSTAALVLGYLPASADVLEHGFEPRDHD